MTLTVNDFSGELITVCKIADAIFVSLRALQNCTLLPFAFTLNSSIKQAMTVSMNEAERTKAFPSFVKFSG